MVRVQKQATLQGRPGFTLVEMLVTLGITGVLAALLLPALQSAREAVRLAECRNHLKQIGLALHSYHDACRMMPINYGRGVYNETDRGASWLSMTLPWLDQAPLYDRIRFGEPLTDPANDAAAVTVVPAFLCPSDSHGDGVMPDRRNSSKPRAVTNYKASLGSNWNWGSAAGARSVSGRHAGNTDGLEWCNGFLCRSGDRPPVPTRFGDIVDGTSTTLAVGEAVPEWSQHTWWYWFNASTATCAVPPNHWRTPETSSADWFENYSFASRHPGGVQFCMADGSVRLIPDGIDLTTYRALATIQGDEVVSSE